MRFPEQERFTARILEPPGIPEFENAGAPGFRVFPLLALAGQAVWVNINALANP